MRCYKCGNTLSAQPFCDGCGAKVTIYKKVLGLSNAYYNMGLAKAQIRDLTGAAELLRRSLRFNKCNTNARNLLGLVYFEMGEAVQAMSEWVISKNLQPEQNIADDYIRKLSANPQRLDTINQTLRKYNLALGYAKQGNDDVAIIQLKKVLNLNQNLIKGHLLLALIYMRKGEYEKARKPIAKVLRIDSNHPLGKRYLKELEEVTGQKLSDKNGELKKEAFTETPDEKTIRTKYDVITPSGNRYKESNAGLMTVINVIIGLVIGVAATFFLLIPAKEKSINDDHNKEILKLNSQIETINREKNDLLAQIETLEGDKETLNGQLEQKGNENTQKLNDYNYMLEAVTKFMAQDYLNCAVNLKAIHSVDYSDTMRNLYAAVKPETYAQVANHYYNQGKTTYSTANSVETWQSAIDQLLTAFTFDYMSINYVDAVDKLGSAYEKQYSLLLQTAPDQAGSYKEKALLNLANLVENVFANQEGIDPKAAEKAQEYITLITSR